MKYSRIMDSGSIRRMLLYIFVIMTFSPEVLKIEIGQTCGNPLVSINEGTVDIQKTSVSLKFEKWLKDQINEDVILNVDDKSDWETSGYAMLILSAIQKNQIKTHSVDNKHLPKVRFDRGFKDERSKRDRILIKRKHKGPTSITFSEIVIGIRSIRFIRHGDVYAKISSKKGRKIFKAKRFKHFLIFNVSSIVDENTKQVRLFYVKAAKRKINMSKINQPLLATYEHIDSNPIFSQKRHKRDNPSTNREHCKRTDWKIDMGMFNYTWYLHPMRYNAGYCSGRCATPLDAEVLNATNYSFIKSLYHVQTYFLDQYVPRACCVPIEYEDQVIYYLTKNNSDVISVLPNMRVTACGCR